MSFGLETHYMSPNNTPEIRDLLNDLHGYQHIKKNSLVLSNEEDDLYRHFYGHNF